MSYRFLFTVVGILGLFGIPCIILFIGSLITHWHWSMFGMTLITFFAIGLSLWICSALVIVNLIIDVDRFDKWAAKTFSRKGRNSKDANG